MTRLSGLLALALSGCNDYHVVASKEDSAEDSSMLSDSNEGDTGGAIGDSSGSGGETAVPVCLDLPVTPAGPATSAPTCTPLDPVDWEMVVKLDITGEPLNESFAGSVVVHPAGSGGGGTIYFQGGDGGVLGVDGTTGEQVWDWADAQKDYNGLSVLLSREGDIGWVAAADLLTDYIGRLNISTLTEDIQTDSETVPAYLFPTGLDHDHDGVPEFATDGGVIDASGHLITGYRTRYYAAYALAADVDGDWSPEIVNSTGIWAFDGSSGVEWHGNWVPDSSSIRFEPGLVRLDGAVTVVGTDGFGFFRARLDGEVEWHRPPYRATDEPVSANPPAVGDATGDGVPDIAGEIHNTLVLLDGAGNLVWQVPRGLRTTGGTSMADLDGDGVYEVIDLSDEGMVIHDGRTGATLARRDDILAQMASVPPVIADVDADGSAEIVVAAYPPEDTVGRNSHIYVLGPRTGRWARTRPVWNQVPYDITSVNDEGRIISFPFPAWETYNAFRAQPAHDGDKPDLVVVATDACATECAAGGTIRVAAQVTNLGSKVAARGTVVRLLSYTTAGGLREIAQTTLDVAVPSMSSAEGVVFNVPWEDWGEQRVLQVDGDQALECDRVNDRTEVGIPDPCGG